MDDAYPPPCDPSLPPYEEARQRLAMALTITDSAQNYIIVLKQDALAILDAHPRG